MSRFRLRLKICINDKTAGICYIISAIVMIALLLSLDSAGEERSAIPIGVVVNDDSEEAREFLARIKDTPSVYVNEGDLESLKEIDRRAHAGSANPGKDPSKKTDENRR